MKLHNDLIGMDNNNVTSEFLSGDNEIIYNKHYLRKGPTWYYRDNKITYSLNENGHRCKSFNDIDFNNYVLYVGCSHTVGIGLELETTYPYLVSKKLNMDYYNLAIPGAGIDVLEYNLITWFLKIPIRPRFTFMQMPDHSRYCSFNPYLENNNIFVESGSWTTDTAELEMLVNSEEIGFFNARKYFTYKNIDHICDSPLIKYNVAGQANTELGIKMRRYDLARDMQHFGIKSHQLFAEDLSKLVIDMHPSLVTV